MTRCLRLEQNIHHLLDVLSDPQHSFGAEDSVLISHGAQSWDSNYPVPCDGGVW